MCIFRSARVEHMPHHSVSQSVSYFTVPPRASLIRQMPDRTDAVRWQSAGRSPSPAPFPRRDNAFCFSAGVRNLYLIILAYYILSRTSVSRRVTRVSRARQAGPGGEERVRRRVIRDAELAEQSEDDDRSWHTRSPPPPTRETGESRVRAASAVLRHIITKLASRGLAALALPLASAVSR